MTQLSRPEPADDLGSTWKDAQKGDPAAGRHFSRSVIPRFAGWFAES